MPMTLRSRPSAQNPTTMPAWVEPVTVQTTMKSNFTPISFSCARTSLANPT